MSQRLSLGLDVEAITGTKAHVTAALSCGPRPDVVATAVAFQFPIKEFVYIP